MTSKDTALVPEPEDWSKSTATAIVAMLPRLVEVQEILQATLAGGAVNEFQLDRVHVPGAGGTTWTIPALDGESENKGIEGVIVGYKYTRGYWSKPYNAGSPTPPDCASNDAVVGQGDRGQYGSGAQDCALCPLSEWGSRGEGRRSQACKTMIPIFVLTPQSLLPVVISIPPSSLRAVQSYLLRIVGQGIPWWGCVTRFELRKKDVGGWPTAIVTPALVSRLSRDETGVIKQYVAQLAPLVKQASVDTEISE